MPTHRAHSTLFEDYQANSLFRASERLREDPLMITIGTSDQFFTHTRQWAADLHPPAAFGAGAGGHGNRYWRSVLPDHVMFLSQPRPLSSSRGFPYREMRPSNAARPMSSRKCHRPA